MTFANKRHIEIDENYQGINLTEFAFAIDKQIDNEAIVDTFVRTKKFSYDSLRENIKKEPNKGFLRRAFDFDKIKVSDFKKTDKNGMSKFLYDFLNEPDWGDDREDFAKLIDWYFDIHKASGHSDFFILSKDWFEKDDERLIEPENWCYTYYFLIVSVNRNSKTLTLTEWTYD